MYFSGNIAGESSQDYNIVEQLSIIHFQGELNLLGYNQKLS